MFVTEPSAVAPDAKVNFADICRQWESSPKTRARQPDSDRLIPASGATALGSVMTLLTPNRASAYRVARLRAHSVSFTIRHLLER